MSKKRCQCMRGCLCDTLDRRVDKLTTIQSRAFHKLDEDWQSAYALDETVLTMSALVKKGLANTQMNMSENPRLAKEYRKVGVR